MKKNTKNKAQIQKVATRLGVKYNFKVETGGPHGKVIIIAPDYRRFAYLAANDLENEVKETLLVDYLYFLKKMPEVLTYLSDRKKRKTLFS